MIFFKFSESWERINVIKWFGRIPSVPASLSFDLLWRVRPGHWRYVHMFSLCLFHPLGECVVVIMKEIV